MATKYSSKEAFYKRINQLAETKKTPVSESRTIGTLINYERGADGIAYGIIQENHNFYIKKAGIKDSLNASDFAYIGGLENITNYQYHSLSTADKQRNLMLTNINESVKVKMNKNNTKININEDVAGEEIDQSVKKLPDLDTATAADTGAGGDMGVDPTASGIDQTNPVIPDLGDDQAIPDPTSDSAGAAAGGMNAPAGDETVPAGDGTGTEELPADDGTDVSPDGATMTTDDSNEEGLEKSIGKITNTIRKTEMEPVEVKSLLNTFIAAFKDKLPDLEIEDRKSIANRIIKVVAGGEEDLEKTMPDDEPVDEMCSECGSFTQYAESRGYTKESIMECDNEEMGSLIGGYANAHGDGKNDGDGKSVALFTNDEIAESLKKDYGHEKYVTEVLEPHMNSLRESTDEDHMAKINELSWGGIKNAAGALSTGIKNTVGAAGTALKGAYDTTKEKIGQVGADVSQAYNKGVQNDKINQITKLAQDLKTKIDALNTATQKAGGQPIDPKTIIGIISNQLTAAVPSNIAKNPGAQKAWQQRADANLGSLKVKEEVNEDVKTNTSGAFVTVPKSPPALPGKKNTDIMGDGNPTLNTTGFKLISKSPPALPGKPKKTIMGEGEVAENVDADAHTTTAVTTAKEAGGDVNKTGFKLISKSPPALPGKPKKTIMGENNVDAGNVEVQPNMIKEVDEIEPDNDADDKGTGAELDFTGDNTPETTETPEITFAPEAENLGVGGLEPKGAGTIDINVDGNTKQLNIQMSESEIKIRKYIRNRIEENAGLRKPSLNESTKSAKIKELDKIIDEQYGVYKSVIKK